MSENHRGGIFLTHTVDKLISYLLSFWQQTAKTVSREEHDWQLPD